MTRYTYMACHANDQDAPGFDVIDYSRSEQRGDEVEYYVMAHCKNEQDAQAISSLLEVASAANINIPKQCT